jgi:hypothetical protein
MSSNNGQMLGAGKVLGHLPPDAKNASSSVWALGPWIDDFFAGHFFPCQAGSIAVL